MKKIKNKNILRIVFSSAALITFVLYSLCDILMVNEYTSYNTYGWRLKVLNYLFLLVPYVALPVFSVMERKLKYINKRTYVAGIFGIYLIQTIVMLFFDGASDFSILCSSWMNRFSDVVTAIMIIRVVVLFLIPIAHKIMIKIYSMGMITVLSLLFISLLTSNHFMIVYGIKGIFALAIDVLFHMALFFFSDYMDKENESESWLCFLGMLMYPIFGSLSDDCEDEDEDIIKLPKMDYALEYKTLFINAINEEDEEFLKANELLRDLSGENALGKDGKMYSTDDFFSCLTIVAERIENINAKKPGFISEGFVSLINMLIAEKDEESFKADVVVVAKLLFAKSTSQWIAAAEIYSDYEHSVSRCL